MHLETNPGLLHIVLGVPFIDTLGEDGCFIYDNKADTDGLSPFTTKNVSQRLKPPSQNEPITFPIFTLTWVTTSTSLNSARVIVACNDVGASGKYGAKNIVRISTDFM